MKFLKNNKQGVILIMVVLVLILLIFIALIFTSVASVEEKSVVVFVNKRKANFASDSGFYYAVTRLLIDMKNGSILNFDWQYMGEDINKNGILDDGEDANGNGQLDMVNYPLDKNSAVSYQYKKPKSNEVANPYFSNVITFGEDYILFRLKIVDEASKININYGNLANKDDLSNENLRRILNTLGGEVGVVSLGDKILNARPENGFSQLDVLINTALTYDEYYRVKDYITTHSYGSRLLKPQGLSGRKSENLREGMPIYSIDEIFPRNISKEVRYFVNINTASLAVLTAVLNGLSGYYLDGSNLNLYAQKALTSNKAWVREGKYTSVPIGIIRKTKAIDLVQAREIARRIIERRRRQPFTDFYNKGGWDEFVEQLYNERVVDFYQKELLRANFNPNVNSYLWNPDLPLRYMVDKFSLENYSFEWTFLPGGFFTIESIGEVFNKDMLLGKTYTYRVAKLWDTLYLSTQEDFAGNSFQYFDNVFSKVRNNLYPTRMNTELDLYPYAYPVVKKASDITGYIGLSTISLPIERLSFSYKKKNKKSILKPKIKISFDKDYKVEEGSGKELLKSYEGLPYIFTDGGFSDTKRTIRFQPVAPPDFDKTVYSPDKPPSTAASSGSSYPVPVAIGIYGGNLTIMSDKLIGFVEEVKVKSEDMFTSMSQTSLVGMDITQIKNKKITLFLPHSCCFWDIYWQGGSVHFYVPEHAEEVMEKYFPPDVLEAIKELCANQEIARIFGGILGSRGLVCPLYKGGLQYSIGVFFWHKGNWINKDSIYPLFSYGRFFSEELYGKNKTASNFEPLEEDDQDRMDELIKLYRKKSRFHSAMIQDFYFALSFVDKGKLFKKNKFTTYFDFATPNKNIITDEKIPAYYNYTYLSSYNLTEKEVNMKEGVWNHLGMLLAFKYNPEGKKIQIGQIPVDRDAGEGETDKIKIAFETKIFNNSDAIPLQTKILYGDMYNIREIDNFSEVGFVVESPGTYVNPGLRFGEYLKRGYAKIDKPGFDPYLYGYLTSQSTYDEIYIYLFDQYSLDEKLENKVAETLYNAGRYYPTGGVFTLENRLWRTIPSQRSFILIQTHHYIPPQLERKCLISQDIYVGNRAQTLENSNNNIFFSKESIYMNKVSRLDIKLNCSRANPPLLESPFIDSVFIFTESEKKEVITSKEIRDVFY